MAIALESYRTLIVIYYRAINRYIFYPSTRSPYILGIIHPYIHLPARGIVPADVVLLPLIRESLLVTVDLHATFLVRNFVVRIHGTFAHSICHLRFYVSPYFFLHRFRLTIDHLGHPETASSVLSKREGSGSPRQRFISISIYLFPWLPNERRRQLAYDRWKF